MGVDEPLVKRVSIQGQTGQVVFGTTQKTDTEVCKAAAKSCLVPARAIGIP